MIFPAHTRNAFLRALEQQHPVALGVVEASKDILETAYRNQDHQNDRMGALAVLVLAEISPAEELMAEYAAGVEKALRGANLGQAFWAMAGATIFDCLEGRMTDLQRQELQGCQQRLANALLKVGKGNPHTVTNNWWGVTHAGLVLATLCLPSSSERDRILLFARNRLMAFLHHFGPACLYHEGLGYQDYTLSQLLPALTALETHGMFSFEQDFPQSRYLAHSLLMPTALIPALSNQPGVTAGFGGCMSWNDAGHAWPGSNVAGLSIRLSDHAPALWSWFLKLAGPDSPGKSFGSSRCGLYATALLYPYDMPVAPVAGPATHVLDTRQGLFMFRTRWQDADDLVVGVYARATHVGGHSQDDAGSLRVIGMGYDWILGGGQNRPQAEWQSVAVPLQKEEKSKTACGAILYEEIHHDSFTLGLDLRKARGAYCERYVSFFTSPTDQVDGALVLLDQIDEHRGLPWSFQLTLSPQHRILEHESGITLEAPDGQCMHLHFFTPPTETGFSQLPESARSFANGNKEAYVNFPVLEARFDARSSLSIYTLITFSTTGHVPEIELREGIRFSLDGREFPLPFSAAVPPQFKLNISKGLCQDPLGQIELSE